MECQKVVEKGEGECQSERLPDSLASILATSYLGRQHDTVDFESEGQRFSSQLCLCTNCMTLGKYLKFFNCTFFFHLISALNST